MQQCATLVVELNKDMGDGWSGTTAQLDRESYLSTLVVELNKDMGDRQSGTTAQLGAMQ